MEDFAAPRMVGRSSAVIGARGRGAERPSFMLREYHVSD